MKAVRVVFAIFFLLTPAGATTVIPMSVEDLTRAASSVVEVEVADSWSSWNAEHSLIYTYSRVRVARALKGGVQPEMVVQELGGSSEGYTMKVAGVHRLEKGEHAVLFLRPARANGGGSWTIVGLMQGHFRVYAAGGKTMVGNGLQVRSLQARGGSESGSAVTFPASAAVSMSTTDSSASTATTSQQFRNPAGSMTMQEFESRVRGALEQ